MGVFMSGYGKACEPTNCTGCNSRFAQISFIFSIYFCFPDHRIGQNMEGLPIEFRVPCWIHGCGQKFFSVYQDEPDKNLTSRLSGFRCFAILGPLWNSTESGLSFRRTRRQSRCAVVDLQIPICQWLIMLYSQLYTFMCVCDNII